MAKEKKAIKPISKRNAIVRIILLVAFIGVAIFFLGRAVIDIFSTKPGWNSVNVNKIEINESESVTPYYGDVQMTYYYESRDAQLNNQDVIESIFNTSLEMTFKEFDETHLYDNINNIAYINAHPNTEIIVSDYLYEVLQSAYNYSLSSQGVYNVFAKYSDDFWMDMFMDDAPTAVDPVYDASNLARLEAITTCVNQQLEDSSTLIFNETNKSVTYQVVEGCTGKVALDLGYLSQAYALEHASNAINVKGYQNGYLASTMGLSLTLGNNPDTSSWQVTLADPHNLISGNSDTFASIYANGIVRSVAITDYSYNYTYALNKAGKVRHPYINYVTGYPANIFRGISYSLVNSGTLDEIYIKSLELFATSPDDVKSALINETDNVYLMGIINVGESSVGYDDFNLMVSKIANKNIVLTDVKTPKIIIE